MWGIFKVYFKEIDGKIILLLIGGDKSTQQKDIEKAKEILDKIQKHVSSQNPVQLVRRKIQIKSNTTQAQYLTMVKKALKHIHSKNL